MAYFGSIATVATQVEQSGKFAVTLAYLAELFTPGSVAAARMRGLAAGETNRVELGGGAFALEQVYLPKVRADGFFESHRKYIDVQVVFEGEEWMEVVDISRAAERQPYNADRDFIVYHDLAGASQLHVAAGQAAVFYPVDVHMPGLYGPGGQSLVRKTVVKVPV